jgi:DNA-binding transcriptional LysR family regulator
MNDLWIRYFLAVVDNEMNFTKASNAVYISQPAISKHINKLGKELGVKLFDTTKKSDIKLTPGGELLYRFFVDYNDKLGKIIASAKALNDQETGELKIATLNGWDISTLNKKIDFFNSKYPNISISIDSVAFNVIEKGLLTNFYDIAITTSAQFEGMQNVYIRKLFPIPRVLLYSVKHKLAAKADLTITDFKDEILYILSADETPLARTINEAYCKSKGFIPTIKTLPNSDSVLLAVESGKGFTILDKWQRIIKSRSFKLLELDDTVVVSAVWRKDNANAVLPLFCKECLE